MSGIDISYPEDFPDDGDSPDKEIYVLSLYIAGPSALSRRAIVNTRRICEEHLLGRYRLDIVDLCQFPERAAVEQIVAAPTLVKRSPLPLRRFVGTMSRSEIIVKGLGLPDDSDSASFQIPRV